MAAKSMQEDLSHPAGLPCSERDCPLPMCINSKVGKMKTDTDHRVANRKRRSHSASDTEDNMELWWQDLQSLGVLEQPADGSIDNITLFQDTNANAIQDDWNHRQDQPMPALQSCRLGYEKHLVGDQSQAKPLGAIHWLGDAIPRSPSVQRSSGLVKSIETYNRQLFSVSQPLATEQTEPSRSAFIALSHDSQVMIRAPLKATNSSSHPQMQYCANGGECGIMGFESSLLEGSNNNKPNVRSSLYEHFKARKFENACEIARKPSHRVNCTRKLFAILSLIFQALDDPCMAELEEHCVHVLQKALNEIWEAKCLSSGKLSS